jgi:hypothetical protein
MSEPRDKLHNFHGPLFQAAIWRKYAMEWKTRRPEMG